MKLTSLVTFFLMAILLISPLSSRSALASAWEGIWFTCEFAQSQRAPDDGCQMFDDEGFAYEGGQLFYLRMIGSTETACRGEKQGQCFKRSLPAISVTKKDVAEVRIEGDTLIARYLGCDQSYRIAAEEGFMAVFPNKKTCFWSRDRHFYIARYEGELTVITP